MLDGVYFFTKIFFIAGCIYAETMLHCGEYINEAASDRVNELLTPECSIAYTLAIGTSRFRLCMNWHWRKFINKYATMYNHRVSTFEVVGRF